MKEYEKAVMDHYDKVAKEDGDSELSTMKDRYVRNKETEAITNAIMAYCAETGKEKLDIVDVGCGNGYTLSEIKRKFQVYDVEGIEKNDSLRKIAEKRLVNTANIHKGDITQPMLSIVGEKDVVISQRVIINLLDVDDQMKAIKNVCDLVKKGGILMMLECFTSSLANLNEARAEFGFAPIEPSAHNLYLDETILPSEKIGFVRYNASGIYSDNFLSSHYYAGRVLHDVVLQGRPFKRNSHFLEVMTKSIPEGIGDYSPIKFYVFKKI